jgi:esterase/lipase superfamily enzyme
MEISISYATNRRHKGANQWEPEGYSSDFSSDSSQNLRFGIITLANIDDKIIQGYLAEAVDADFGNGDKLADYLTELLYNSSNFKIKVYQEKLEAGDKVLGSEAFFTDNKNLMMNATDSLIYIHGFNVTWEKAVASAIALQLTLNKRNFDIANVGFKNINVVLFSWASDGKLLLYVPYLNDRHTAEQSATAFARALLFLRDFLAVLRKEAFEKLMKEKKFLNDSHELRTDNSNSVDKNFGLCRNDIHLLCHSMGNYVLQNAILYIATQTNGKFDRLLENVFLCAADVDTDVLENNQALSRLQEICNSIYVYYNQEDKALIISEYSKRFADRLGSVGPIRPEIARLGKKVHSIDCTDIVDSTFSEHSYYLNGLTNKDIWASIVGIKQKERSAWKEGNQRYDNVWKLKQSIPG